MSVSAKSLPYGFWKYLKCILSDNVLHNIIYNIYINKIYVNNKIVGVYND